MTHKGNLISGEIMIGHRERHFTIRLPHLTSIDRPLSLVLVLHGNHPNAGGWMMREWTTFDQQSDAWGMAVAYPDAHQGCWADGRGTTSSEEAGIDDVEFLRAVIDWSAEHYNIAPDRTVVAGMSNGAFMAHRLAVEASDQVAVVAAVAGGMPHPYLTISQHTPYRPC